QDDRGRAEGELHRYAAGAAPPAARGKKITRSASRGTSSKRLTSSASRRPPLVSVDTAAHMPASSSARNAAISSASSSGISTSPSASTISPCPGVMRRSLIASDYGKGTASSGEPERAGGARPLEAEDVHRPRARTDVAQPVGDRLAGQRPGGA